MIYKPIDVNNVCKTQKKMKELKRKGEKRRETEVEYEEEENVSKSNVLAAG